MGGSKNFLPLTSRLTGWLVGMILAVLFLSYFSSRVLASPVIPQVRPVLPISRDGFVGVVWDLPRHDAPLEWLVQAGLDEGFTKIVDESGWIRPRLGSFFLQVPQGRIFIRVGAREVGGQEIIWSEIQESYQIDEKAAHWVPSFPEEVPRPIVFIHGLDGRPDDWIERGYGELFTGHGYDPSWLWLYAYADYDYDGAYDADGEIVGIARDLPSVINQLRKVHQKNGGEGKVDIVAFSLGGLVGRTYLRSILIDPGVAKFVNVATPHLGVKWLMPWDKLYDLPFGPFIQKALATAVKGFYEEHQARPLDLESPAVAELVPESEFLDWINEEAPSEKIDYHLIYGDLKVSFSQTLFHLKLLSPEYSLGDLLIDSRSATTIPGVKPKIYPYTSSQTWRIKALKNKAGWGYEVELDLPRLKYWHSQLIRQSEVKRKILEILQD